MSDLKGMRVNAAVEAELEAGACVGIEMMLEPNALPPPWAHLIDEVLASDEERVSTHRGRPWMPWEIIL